mgnify:CR=1 FL=1
MRNALKIALAFLLLAGAGFGVAAFPDRWVQVIGGALSPRGAISDSFVPVFRKVLIVVGGSLSAILLGVACWGRGLHRWMLWFYRRIRHEWSDVANGLQAKLCQTTPLEYAGIVVLLSIGVGLRLWYVNQPMRFDEATTVTLYASSPWYIGLANYTMPNNHLLNTLLVRISMLLGGDREWVVRLPALLAGLLCLPLTYVYARLTYSREAAILALAWLCVSLPFVDMSTNARGYTMVACCGLTSQLSTYFLLRRGSGLAAIANAGAIGLGLVAVPVAVLFVASGLVWASFYACALHRHGRLNPVHLYLFIGSVLAGFGIAAIGYAPMLLILGPKWLLANEWVRPLAWASFIRELPEQLWAYGRYNSLYLPGAAVAVLALSAGYYLAFWKKIENTKVPLPILLAGICLVSLMLNRRYPLWGVTPMWMYLSIVLCGAISAGFAHAVVRATGPRRARPLVWLAAWILVGAGACNLVRANPRQTMDSTGGYSFPDTPQVARYLADHASPRDEILLDNAQIVHQYYAHRCGADDLNWSWRGQGPRRIFVLETSNPNPRFAEAMWIHLGRLGIQTTNDLSLDAEFSDQRIWSAEINP